MRYAPIAFITGQTGKNVKALINHGQMLFKQSRARVSTGQLNRMLREAVRQNAPPPARNREPKIYYATQVGIQPPTIVLFVNEPVADLEAVPALPARQIPRRARDSTKCRSSSICAAGTRPICATMSQLPTKSRRESPTANRQTASKPKLRWIVRVPGATPQMSLLGRCPRHPARLLATQVSLNAERIGGRSEVPRGHAIAAGLLPLQRDQ